MSYTCKCINCGTTDPPILTVMPTGKWHLDCNNEECMQGIEISWPDDVPWESVSLGKLTDAWALGRWCEEEEI